jgi:hypothetical protein
MIDAILQRVILLVWGLVVAVTCLIHPVRGIRLVLASIEFMDKKVVDKRG